MIIIKIKLNLILKVFNLETLNKQIFYKTNQTYLKFNLVR